MTISFLSHSWKKYLILLPIVILVLNAFYFQFATDKINEAILQEKFIEAQNHVNMLASAVEANKNRFWIDHERNIINSVEYLCRLPQTFAATYKPMDGMLKQISELNNEKEFDPRDYDMFTEAIKQDSGEIILSFTPENGAARDMHVYFTHMPMYAPPEERYLVVAAVSKFSVVTSIPEWVSSGQWLSMIVTFFINVWLTILIARLGTIYERCEKRQCEGCI